MSYRAYFTFRPNLHGAFLERFHLLAREVAQALEPVKTIENTALEEYQWATHRTLANPRQRRIYRASWLFLRDLVRAGWTCRWSYGSLEIAPPAISRGSRSIAEMQSSKAALRNIMKDPRRHRIIEAHEFIERMENPSPQMRARVPITSLIADGPSLARDLSAVVVLPDRLAQIQALGKVVQPYLQLVRENEVCPETGHKLSDIWRYFRFTWTTPAENTPGRTMLYLIRDAARPYHPVMGLASLENATIKITDRDDHIGWTLRRFRNELELATNEIAIRKSFERLLHYVYLGIQDINIDGLCTEEECENPSETLLQRLRVIAARSEEARQEALRNWEERDNEVLDTDLRFERSELGNISRAVEDALYLRKRAEQLARLLSAKSTLQQFLDNSDVGGRWSEFLNGEKGQIAIRTSLVAQKSRHIGTSMLELNICGAIPPYNELLAGKLVALMVLSPQVVADYRERYGNRPSDIASRLKGLPVVRPAELVFIGTTSLYLIGTSQYNRLKLPARFLRDDAPEIKWREIGKTTGYGTWHTNRLTLQCFEEITNADGVPRVNHIFGEGPSPKLRTLRRAFEEIFEPGQKVATGEMAKHAMGRLVYGAWLAVNGRAYLLGQADKPEYYFDEQSPPHAATDKIVGYWRERWLLTRLAHTEALERVATFNSETLHISRELVNESGPAFVPIPSEVNTALPETGERDAFQDFLRNLYRGPSAYADRIQLNFLDAIHVETRLDQAVLRAVSGGKSVILTGNPGDGKTHLLRVLNPRLSEVPNAPVVILDASSIIDSHLYDMWVDAEQRGAPFCIAINEAVLFSLAAKYQNFAPLQEARHQVENAVVYGDELPLAERVVVFDLSRRNALSSEIITAVVDKLTDLNVLARCNHCPREGCDFVRHSALLRRPEFQERFQKLLDRVSRRGNQATLRDVQGFISYLLFGGRNCTEMLQTTDEHIFAITQLLFSGHGKLFDAIRETFDPARVSHPIWDDILVFGETSESDWFSDWFSENGAIEPANFERFEARKRAFYFCHTKGEQLLSMAGQDEYEFERFLDMPERDALRLLIRRINRFFGYDFGGDKLRVWQSHRYNQATHRVLYSVTTHSRQDFELVAPHLCVSMSTGFDLVKDHLILRLRDRPQIRLRIDFSLFELLAKAERGVPVMFIEGESSRRLWQFMEHFSESNNIEGEISVLVLDPVNGEHLKLVVDVDSRRYLSIERAVRH